MLTGTLPEPAKAKKACFLCRRKKTKCVKFVGESQCENCKKRSIICQFEDTSSNKGVNKSWKWQHSNTNTNTKVKLTNTKSNFPVVTPPSISPPHTTNDVDSYSQDFNGLGNYDADDNINDETTNELLDFDPMELYWDVEDFERQLEENIGKTFNIDFDLQPELNISSGNLPQNTKLQNESNDYDQSIQPSSTILHTPPSKRVSISNINPHNQTSDDLFNLFFNSAAYISDMINQEKFKDNMRKNIPLTLTLGDAILAHSYLYLNSPKRASSYYFKARLGLYKFLDDDEYISMSFYSVTSIQILLILSDYELKVGKWATSNLTFSRALMLSRMRGIYVYDTQHPFSLNKKLDDEFQVESDESAGWPEWMIKEETRRTFFKVYCYDKYITLYKGVYESFPYERVSVQLPLECSLTRGLIEPTNEKRRPFIKEILPRLKNGEKIDGLGPLSVHLAFLSLVSCGNLWVRSICMNEIQVDEMTLSSYLIKMNEIISQMEGIHNNYREEFELYNRLGDLVREIMKLKLYHGLIFVISRILEMTPNEYTDGIDDIYYDIKEKCLNQTVSLIAVFDKLDLGKLVIYNPFFTLALHCSIKSAIQIFIICKQPNCTNLEGEPVSQLFNEISNVINHLEKLDKRPPLLTSLMLFYNTKMESYDRKPFSNVFFEDTLLFS